MNEEERYVFDLQGYLVIENVIAPAALAEMNAWLDVHSHKAPVREGQTGAYTWPGVLAWGPEFRALLDNPRVLPYLEEVLGDGFRLDHEYLTILEPGAGPLHLHGGGAPFDAAQYYHYANGVMRCGLTVATYALGDVPSGMGGFACIPGSHKSNFICPEDIQSFERPSPMVRIVPVKAGDCIVFTEALMHGTAPWKAGFHRRTLFFKFNNWQAAYSRHMFFDVPGQPGMRELESQLTASQRKLLRPPGA